MNVDLEAEFECAAARLLESETAIQQTLDIGIRVEHWEGFRARFGIWPIGVSTDERFVTPAPEYGAIVDLVAWSATDPANWRLRRRDAILLGAEAADRADLFGDPVRVHANPLQWILAAGSGVVVLDWAAFLPLHLPDRLLVADQVLGNRLRRALTAPPVQFEIRLEAA